MSHIKVHFRHAAFDDESYEGIWVSNDNGNLIIDNIPFYVKGFAVGDIISVEEHDGLIYAKSLIKQSGHSVIQILFSDAAEVSLVREKLEQMGCSSELSNLPNLVAIDIPKDIVYKDVIAFLETGETQDRWEYQEACISDYHKRR